VVLVGADISEERISIISILHLLVITNADPSLLILSILMMEAINSINVGSYNPPPRGGGVVRGRGGKKPDSDRAVRGGIV
jgi:hypothetical protein